MAKFRRGGKTATKSKNDKSPEVSEDSRAVDKTYVLTETDGSNEIDSSHAVIPEAKVTVEKCDAFLVKHKSEGNEDEDSFMEPGSEDEEEKATAVKEEDKLPEDESDKDSNEEEVTSDQNSDSEEVINQSVSAQESALDESTEEEEKEEEKPKRSTKPKLPAISVQQDEASKKTRKGTGESEKIPTASVSKYDAPVKATGSNRNPGKVASVAEKKKQASAAASKLSGKGAALGPKNTAKGTETKNSSSKGKIAANNKSVVDKPISDAKKDLIIDLLMDGLSKHDERKGVSMPTIKKYVVENDLKERSWSKLQPRVKKALDSALEEGKILRPKGNEHMNGMVGRFKVNKKFGTKKRSKKITKSPEKESSPVKKVAATSKPTKTSAATAKSKKQSTDKEERLSKESKVKASKGPNKRSLKIFSTDDSEEEFQDPNPIKATTASKTLRRKSKSGGDFVKPNAKGPPKPKTMKRSHSVENLKTTTTAQRGRPRTKK